MTKSIFVFATLAVTLFSCKKEKEEEVVTAAITFNTPSANDTIPFGAAVHLTGTISGQVIAAKNAIAQRKTAEYY